MPEFGCYILAADGRTPVRVEPLQWSEWWSTADRIVARDTIEDVIVSTVFLGVGLRSMLWETAVLGPLAVDIECRYSSHDDAVAGHARVIEALRCARAIRLRD